MPTQAQKDELCRLMDRVSAIADSAENQRRIEHWRRYHAGVPARQDPEGPLFTLDIGIPTWARMLGFDVRQFYGDTYTQIRYQLLMRIYHHEHMRDDTVVGRGVGINPVGVVLEPSMLGVEIGYPPDMEPWALHDRAVVQESDDLDRLGMPDFRTAGAMPAVLCMYDQATELMAEMGKTGGQDGDEWRVGFPMAIRGVLGLAQAMRGPPENILMDMLERPAFAHRLFAHVTDFHCHYMIERARFLGEPLGLGHIGNDEVSTPFVSPALYEEFLLPYETRISEFHGGLNCWHSCGTTTALLPAIRRIPGIRQFYTGPWTDLNAVMRAFGTEMPLYIAINTVDDVMAATPQQMEARIRSVLRVCGDAPLQIRAGAMNSAFNLEADLAQMRLWTAVAQQVRRNLECL